MLENNIVWSFCFWNTTNDLVLTAKIIPIQSIMFSFCIVYLRESMMMIIQSITQEQRKTETSFERISLYLKFWHSSSKCLNVKLLASKRWVVSRLPYVHLRYFVSICTSSSLLRCSWKTNNWGWHFKQSMTLHHT